MNSFGNILIIDETSSETVPPVTRQLITAGRNLAMDLGTGLHMLHIGYKKQEWINEYFGYGVDMVHTVTDPVFEKYMADTYIQAIESALMLLQPSVIIFGHTDRGMDLAPRLAFRLNGAVTLDCVSLAGVREKEKITTIKPVYGGKAHAAFSFSLDIPCIVTVRENAFDPAEITSGSGGEINELDITINPEKIRTRFIRKIRDENLETVRKLENAGVVVGGGRGLKKKEGVDLLKETAVLFEGAVAGSRPAIDYGWIPASLQVGLTGKKINPKVYIAVGISGALQHMAGCMKSGLIVAINTDDSAPVFRFAHLGVVGDYRDVLRGFNEEIRKLKS